MKKTLIFLFLVISVISFALPLASCGRGAEDIRGVKETSVILEYNFFETEVVEKEKLAEAGASEFLNSYIVAKNDKGDKIVICYAKSKAMADTVFEEIKGRVDSEDYLYGQSEKTVFYGTDNALKCATKKLFHARVYHTFIEDQNYMYMVKGIGNTIIITLGALLIGVILGVSVAVLKYYSEGNSKLKIISIICDIYTTVIRGIPITVLLLIFFFVILVSAHGVLVAIIAFGINSGAYMAELVRSGINAVDKGQMEAARSLGMSKWQSMRSIIFPQAIKNVLPAIGNECIALLKETSVAGYVAVVDLTRGANLIRNNTYDAFLPLMLSAAIYLGLVVFMTEILKIFERRLKKSERRINK